MYFWLNLVHIIFDSTEPRDFKLDFIKSIRLDTVKKSYLHFGQSFH